jgi:SAM-dependent methyltransferase
MQITNTPAAHDVEPAKQVQRFIWSQGDYPELSSRHSDSATRLVAALSIEPGTKLLDVAAGDGNVAVAAALAGAIVTATDITPRMVELGRERTQREGQEIEWLEADAEQLPFDEGTFDVVSSAFGAMFAPRPEVAAAELMRVIRPEGMAGLTAWTPAGFIGRFASTITSRLPVPAPLPAPTDWGVPEIATERLSPYASDVSVSTEVVTLAHDSVDAGMDFMERANGPLIAARTLLRDDYRELRAELTRLMEEFNHAQDGSLRVAAEYLLIVARKSPEDS